MHANASISSESLDEMRKLILVPAQAVYVGRRYEQAKDPDAWKSPADWPEANELAELWAQHVAAAIHIADVKPATLVMFSGGTIAPEVEDSGGQGLFDLAVQAQWFGNIKVASRACREEYARDSFEHLLFGIERFQEITKKRQTPETIIVVGPAFQQAAFELHAQTIALRRLNGIGRFELVYEGINDPPEPILSGRREREAQLLDEYHRHPLGDSQAIHDLRAGRDPHGLLPSRTSPA